MSMLFGRVLVPGLAGVLLVAGAAAAAGPQANMNDHHRQVAAADHQHHHAMMAGGGGAYERSVQKYALPAFTLRDQAGRKVPVSELDGGSGPLAVNFIFATCTTICPVMSATFSQLLHELGPEAGHIRLVSITIDPEHDTPTVLAALAKRFDAPANWTFLTGNPGEVEQVVRAFDAWTGSKATHRPITLLRREGESEWVRLEGLGSGTALAEQVRAVIR